MIRLRRMGTTPALPAVTLLRRQAEWLAPVRARLLRQVHIARRTHILDLGTGYGAVVPELVRRGGGSVVAMDRVVTAMHDAQAFQGAHRVAADATTAPFRAGSFDLILSQITLLWVSALHAAIAEIWRVLQPGGVLIALEPDYGGMIEYPPEVTSQSLWLNGLRRAGADPHVGRKLPGLLSARGFKVRVSLFDTLFPPHLERFEFLRDLPLTEAELQQLDCIEQAARMHIGPWAQVAHLPFFLITATKPA